MDGTFHDLAVFVITIITGIIGVPIIQFLKNQFGWEDRVALLLAMVVSLILGVIEIVLSMQFDWANLTFEDLHLAFTVIFAAATVYYQLFKGTKTPLGEKFMIPKSADKPAPAG